MNETKPRPGRKRNLKTIREVAQKRSALKQRPFWLKRLLKLSFSPLTLAWRWLNQPVHTHANANEAGLAANLTRPRSMLPAYVRDSIYEIKQVTWPNFGVAMRLTFAVFIFATFFAVIVASLDWVLTQIFEEIILNKAENLRSLF